MGIRVKDFGMRPLFCGRCLCCPFLLGPTLCMSLTANNGLYACLKVDTCGA